MNRLLALALAAALAGASSAAAQTVVSTDVTTNTTWSGTIVLTKPIFVKSGATLTILPGTIVRGQPRTAAPLAGSTVGTPGALIVTQNGRLVADANVNNPIIMTTAAVDDTAPFGVADDDDSNGFKDAWVPTQAFLDSTPTTAPLSPLDANGKPNVSLWGGLVVLGNAPTNLADKALTPQDPNFPATATYGKHLIEGLTVPGFPAADATYGGVLPHDNSGTLRYVSVRHAGDELGSGNELNGVSLGGVGDGTLLDYVEVYCNFDDGIEWFGGTVSGSHLVVVFAGDDSFDMDQGYTGINQFLFAVMPFFKANSGNDPLDPNLQLEYGSLSGDKACEFDGDDYNHDLSIYDYNVNTRLNFQQTTADPTPWPLSGPAVWNMTILGTSVDAPLEFTPVRPASANTGCQMRNGFAGFVYNSIVVNTGTSRGLDVPNDSQIVDPNQPVNIFTVQNNATNGLLGLVSSTLDDGGALTLNGPTAVANGNALATKLGGTANVVNDPNFPNLVEEDQTFNPIGVVGKLSSALKTSKIDPRPNIGLVGTAGGVAPFGPGVNRSGTYRGAFPIGVPLWTNKWTALAMGGLL